MGKSSRSDLSALLCEPGTVLLDTGATDSENTESLLFSTPHQIVSSRTLDEVPGAFLALDEAVRDGLYAAGYVSYEAGYAFEKIGQVEPGYLPLVWFGLYDEPLVLSQEETNRLLERADDPFSVTGGRFGLGRGRYREKIEAIKAHIHEGDVYQINFTAPYTFRFSGSPLSLYRALRRRQRVAYGAWICLDPATHILSLSPELFFRRAGDLITTRPMKGTIPRGRTRAEDEENRRTLTEDAKSRAENLMIVDLLRNDLSRCCKPDTVRVPRLFESEVYDTLIQMTSTVEGQLRKDVTYAEIFRDLFPCGSVTGAPKIRAMQLIREIEETPRGVYCGAVGFVAPNRRAVFNVAIRTIVLQNERGVLGLGSGVVWDSEAEAEYDECLLKARFFTDLDAQDDLPPFALIETMLWDGKIDLLPLHVERLRDSATYFGFPFSESSFVTRIEQESAHLPPGERYKVRAVLDAEGRLTVTKEKLGPVENAARTVCLASIRSDPANRFLYHKTTRRDLYEEEYVRAVEAGYSESIFLNTRGGVTEGTRTNVFIRKGDRYLTPPVECGLLAGVYRRHLLETLPRVEERVLYPKDLAEADAVYVCNAVWGLVEVRIEGLDP